MVPVLGRPCNVRYLAHPKKFKEGAQEERKAAAP